MTQHKPVTTLQELDTLDEDEMVDGYLSAKIGDPEPGANHSRSYHHGWRMRMMDYGEIQAPWEHSQLVHDYVERKRRTP